MSVAPDIRIIKLTRLLTKFNFRSASVLDVYKHAVNPAESSVSGQQGKHEGALWDPTGTFLPLATGKTL